MSDMTDARPHVMEFLLSRRSRPYKTLKSPAPTREELMPILTAAARTPDHGKLEPWRFIVLGAAELRRLGDLCADIATRQGRDEADIQKARLQFDTTPLAVAVIECPVPSAKVPMIEQSYSAGAVCLALLNAALASGWGANWLSGWISHERDFVETGLGLAPEERVAGFIHIGTASATPPERPRPDLATLIDWRDA